MFTGTPDVARPFRARVGRDRSLALGMSGSRRDGLETTRFVDGRCVRHHHPGGQVRQHAEDDGAGEERQDDPEQADCCRIQIEVLGNAAAHAGNLSVGRRAHEAFASGDGRRGQSPPLRHDSHAAT